MKKIAIVTGCAKGIGKEIALELARYGYNIIGTYNTSFEEVKKLKEKIGHIGVDFNYFKLDLSNELEITNFCKNIKSEYKNIDVLVNNAALCLDNEFKLKTKKEFMKVLEVNLIAPFLLIQNLYNIMGNGVIINISSTDGINTYSTLNIDYSASKAALINLTKSLALTLPNIKIYSISPNWVDTESIREMNQDYLNEEMKRIGQTKLITKEEVAKKVIYLINSNLESGSNEIIN